VCDCRLCVWVDLVWLALQRLLALSLMHLNLLRLLCPLRLFNSRVANFDPTVFADQRQAKIDVVALRRQQQAFLVSQMAPLLPPNLQQILTLSRGENGLHVLAVCSSN